MNNNKTKSTQHDPFQFIEEKCTGLQKQDCIAIIKLFESITKASPLMWGQSMIGFGTYHYRYDSGREGDWFCIGLAPRKNEIVIYLATGYEDVSHLSTELGKCKMGKSCLYIKKLSDIKLDVLIDLVNRNLDFIRERYT